MILRRRPVADPTTDNWPAVAAAIPGDTTPYALPTSAPWNAPVPCVTPTVHGGDQAVHPSVVDFGDTPWHGYRFWMAMTPMTDGDISLENPCVIGSHDGFTWEEPVGSSNPVDDRTEGVNSDTELVYDPDTDRLICYWRAYGSGAKILAKWSADGVSWSAKWLTVPYFTSNADYLSPTVIRRGPGDWWMFATASSKGYMLAYRAASPWSGWGDPTPTIPLNYAAPWHTGLVWDGVAFRMIGTTAPGLTLWSSPDGFTWSSHTNALAVQEGKWDSGLLYRATLTVKDDTWMRVWYSAHTSQVWHVGYTQLPRSLWPAPPAVP